MISQVLFVVLAAASASAQLFHGPVHHVEHHAPQPYKFGYSVKDHHGEQHREESGDGGHGVRGSYGFTDDRGVHRQVNYVADHAGFRAQVKTNEPGTANQNPAAVHIISDAPAHGHYLGGLGYNGYNGYAAAPVAAAVPSAVGYGYNGAGYGYNAAGYGYNGAGYGYNGLGYGYNNLGYSGYAGYGDSNGYGYGLASGLLGGLNYPRYGF